MKKTTVGFAMTGSYCTFEKNLAQMEELVRRGYEVLPILSYNAGELDTRFMTAEHLRERLVSITGHEPIDTLQAAEPLGPKKMTDLYLISPASGNTLAKLVNGIYDTPVLLGAKSHLRNDAPVVIGVSTNDALGGAAKNIGQLLNYKHFYFVPFGMDNCYMKPKSMVCDFARVPQSIELAAQGQQIAEKIFLFRIDNRCKNAYISLIA